MAKIQETKLSAKREYNAEVRKAEQQFNDVKEACEAAKEEAKKAYDAAMKKATTEKEKAELKEIYQDRLKVENQRIKDARIAFDAAMAKAWKKWDAARKKKTGRGSYKLYLGTTLMPVCPSSMEISINNQNETINLLNGGEINLIKKAGLTDIKFDLLLPNSQYPFAVYKNGFKRAYYYLKVLENLKNKKKPFNFIFYRQLPDGTNLYQTAMKVTLEEYTMEEDAEKGLDVTVNIELKQYIEYGAKVAKLQKNGKIVQKTGRAKKEVTLPTVHTVRKTDTIWSIAKKYYGNELKYKPIYKENKKLLKTPESLVAGMKLMIPKI